MALDKSAGGSHTGIVTAQTPHAAGGAGRMRRRGAGLVGPARRAARRAWANVRIAARTAGRHPLLTGAALMVMNIALAATTQLLAASEPRVALVFQAIILGFTAVFFTVAIVSRTLIGTSQIRIDPRRTSNWWRSKVLGKGVHIRRQDFSPSTAPEDRQAEMPRLERRGKHLPLRVLFVRFLKPRGLDPSAQNIYELLQESLNLAWDDFWTTTRDASLSLILVASALLVMDAGLAGTGLLVAGVSPYIARGLRTMELCATLLILTNGIGLMALGVTCMFMRREQHGMLLVLAGYALMICPIMTYMGQCSVILPFLAGCAGVAAAMLALVHASPQG